MHSQNAHQNDYANAILLNIMWSYYEVNNTRISLVRLHSHRHEYESDKHEFVYFNSGHSHTYEYGLPVNFTHTSSFYAGHVSNPCEVNCP